MRLTIYLPLLLLLGYACSGEKSNFTVEVRVSGSQNTYIHLARRTLTGTIAIDSALPDKSGAFVLEGYTVQPDFFIVYLNPRQYINLIIQPGDDFRVITEAASFDVNYLIEGSKDSRLIQKLVNMQTRTLEKITEITTLYENSIGNENFDKIKAGIDSTYDKVFAEHKQFSIDLINENPGSLVGLMALYQQLGRNAPVFNYKKDFRYYELVDSNLTALYPNSEAVIDLNRKVNELKDLLRLELGSLASDMALPDSTGSIVKLSSLRNKNVLLVFWASWSSQSVSELKKYASFYPESVKKNLEYYQVSLDRTHKSWTRAMGEKSARGIHVCDLNYWDSPVVDLYKLEKLPVAYLLDINGLIVKKNFTADDFPAILSELP